MRIPLPEGFQGLEDFPRQQENLINLFNPDNKVISTPGLEAFVATPGFCRGKGFFDSSPYFINGDRFIRVNENQTIDDLASIPGTGDIQTTSSFTEMALVNEFSGETYVWDGTTLTNTTGSGSMPLSRDVDSLAGRAVYVPQDGGVLAYSELNDFGTVNGTNFFDAQTLPDKNIGVINMRETLYVLGENSIEPFRASTDPDLPFVPVQRGAVQVGYVAGKTFFGNNFAFLGRQRDGAYSFYSIASETPISSPQVDEILNTYDESLLQQCRGMRFKHKGYEVVAFQLIDRTFCYCNGRWFFMETGVSGQGVNNRWQAAFIQHAYGEYLVGSDQNSFIATLSDINTEFDALIERELTTFARFERGSYITANTICWDGKVGCGSESSTIGVSVSNDGELWSPFLYRGLGEVGDYQKRVYWVEPGGFGDYENFMGMRFRVVNDVDVALDFIEVEF